MAQFGRPDSDITTTEIVGGFTDIDEVSFSDADYLTSNDNTTAVYECGLSDVTDPVSAIGHICSGLSSDFKHRYISLG